MVAPGTKGMAVLIASKSGRLLHAGEKRLLTSERRRALLIDLREGLFRVCTLAFASIFVYRGIHEFILDPTRLNVAVLTVSEILTFTWLLLSRRPLVRDWNPLTVIVSIVASFGAAFITFQPGVPIIPVYVAAPLQSLALWFVIWGKISLGRSFAILPANRGVMTSGAYRLVRHPIYAGYLVGHILFLLSAFSFYNLAVYSLITFFQVHRILREEALLAATPEYRAYMARVRYRLFYGIA
jgi:protein-S-isoprenylcysteine O-methyltransferase Ste14